VDGLGIAVAVGPIGLLPFPSGNYRAAVDWMLEEGGLEKVAQAQAASAAVMGLVSCFACLEAAAGAAPSITPAASAAALAFLYAELEANTPDSQQVPDFIGGLLVQSSAASERPRQAATATTTAVPPLLRAALGNRDTGVVAVSSGLPDCCPAGHKLTANEPVAPVMCDVCEEVLMAAAHCLSCVDCEYDLCHPCFAGGRAGSTAEEAVGDEDDEGDGNEEDGGGGWLVRLLRDACTAIEELATASTPLSALHRRVHVSVRSGQFRGGTVR
jgi:hypothetical protein